MVQRLFADRALIVLLAAAILCTACSMFTDASSGGGRCASKACTYFDANGQSIPGTCGAIKTDQAKCYCIVNRNKKLAQTQLGCSASPGK